MKIYISQNSAFFVLRYFLKFFEQKNSMTIFVIESKRGRIKKIFEIAKNFGILNFAFASACELIYRPFFINRLKSIKYINISDNELNQFLQTSLVSEKGLVEIYSIGCPCKIDFTALSQSNITALNLHGGILPHQIGRFSPIRSLATGHQVLGCSIHKISSDFDKGEIFSQSAFIVKEKNVLLNYLKVLKLSKKLLQQYQHGYSCDLPDNIKKYFN
jgi:hypothetical protein